MDSRTRGTTLPELLAVLGILSLLTVMGLSKSDTAGAAAEAEQFTLLLTRSISYAKRKAVATKERITLCASTDAQSCQRDWTEDVSILVFSDQNGNYQLDDGDLLHHSQQLSLRQGWGYWRGSLGRPYMRFRTNGSAVEYGRYSYCPRSGNMQHFRQLVVNRVGRAYQHHDGGGKTSDCSYQQ